MSLSRSGKHLRKDRDADFNVSGGLRKRLEESQRLGNLSNVSKDDFVSRKMSKTMMGGNLQQLVTENIASCGRPRKSSPIEGKYIKRMKDDRDEDEDLKGLEEMYYGIMEGNDNYFERYPSVRKIAIDATQEVRIFGPESSRTQPVHIECPVCKRADLMFNSNAKLQLHLLSHIDIKCNEKCEEETENKLNRQAPINQQDNGKDVNKEPKHQCLYCLAKYSDEDKLKDHKFDQHPIETKGVELNRSLGGNAFYQQYRCLICHHRLNSVNLLTTHMQNKHGLLELPYVCQACNYRTSSHSDIMEHFYEDHKYQNFLLCPFCLDVSTEIVLKIFYYIGLYNNC